MFFVAGGCFVAASHRNPLAFGIIGEDLHVVRVGVGPIVLFLASWNNHPIVASHRVLEMSLNEQHTCFLDMRACLQRNFMET